VAWGFRNGCSRTEKEKAFLEEMSKEGPVQEAYNVKFLFSEMANVQARLTAPHVIEKIVGKENVSYFDRGLRITFFNEQGEVKSDLKAQKGQFYQMFGFGQVWDSVFVQNEEGHQIYTPDTLVYDKKNDRIHSRKRLKRGRKGDSTYVGNVKIQTDTDTFYGDSLEANLDFSQYEIFNFSGSAIIKDN
jgi:hypothetical protein